jgi:flavorubredoxin
VVGRKDEIPAVFDAYDRFIAGETENKIVVAYSTMWGATDVLARAIADGAAEAGADVVLFDVVSSPLAHITRHVMDARAVLVGSPTLHRGMLYRTASLLQYLWGIKPKGKIGGAFGSSWSGGQPRISRSSTRLFGADGPPDVSIQARGIRSHRGARGAASLAIKERGTS